MDVAVLLILAADFGFTTLHSWQEWKGAGGPLWRNFGAIVGLEIPDAIGFPLFTVGLTLMLFAVGFIAIIGPLGHTWTAFALGALIGARLSDTLVSHVRLYVKGYRPNPGAFIHPALPSRSLFPRLAVSHPSFSKLLHRNRWLRHRSGFVCSGPANVAAGAAGVAVAEAHALATREADAVGAMRRWAS